MRCGCENVHSHDHFGSYLFFSSLIFPFPLLFLLFSRVEMLLAVFDSASGFFRNEGLFSLIRSFSLLITDVLTMVSVCVSSIQRGQGRSRLVIVRHLHHHCFLLFLSFMFLILFLFSFLFLAGTTTFQGS